MADNIAVQPYEGVDDVALAYDISVPLDHDTDARSGILGAFASLTSWTGAASYADEQETASGNTIVRAYTVQFIRQMILAFVFGLVCNGFWGIPLYQVVDVNLALSLSFLVLLVAGLGIVFFIEIFNQMWRGALETVFYIATAIFLPFGAIVGYMIYGWLGGGDVTSASFVYKLYVGLFGSAYAWLATVTGDIFGLIQHTKNAAGEMVATVNMEMVKVWVPILASVATILNVFRDFLRSARTVAR